jgi:hypothetical protein
MGCPGVGVVSNCANDALALRSRTPANSNTKSSREINRRLKGGNLLDLALRQHAQPGSSILIQPVMPDNWKMARVAAN